MSDPRDEFSRLHDGEADYAAWKNYMDEMLRGYPIYRIKIWNKSSQVIWSDDPSQIGQKYTDNDELEEALKAV